jgi:hypothetical protein
MKVRIIGGENDFVLLSEDGGPYNPKKPSRSYPAGYVLDLSDGDAGNLINRGLAEEARDAPAPAPALAGPA